ncbi:MAG: GNAT family N-acetyltransferase [Pseudomonadota bacterium]
MMQVTLSPLPRAEAAWLHAVAVPYFAELAPALDPPAPGYFDKWWTEAGRAVHLISANTTPAGFAMIRQEDGGHELSEFCILPALRGTGIGAQAAALCLALHPGPWTLGVAKALPGTARFWDRLLPSLACVTDLRRRPALTTHQSHSYTFTVRGP